MLLKMMVKMKQGKAMINLALKTTLLLCLVFSHPAWAQDDEVRAATSVSIQQNGEIWAGQQVTVNLDLKTTGFSFSNAIFNLPEVSGGFLMQIDSTTIKISEEKDGDDWQILRYPLALFPQKSGELTIPAINVRFSTSLGFGTTRKSFEFDTEPLTLSISLPPGVGEDEMVITTRSFQLDHNWQPETTIAKTGDAFTLTVKRSADDISAILLPSLPVYQTRGLAAYPQTPNVKDKTNRGDLVGERSDSVTWVVEEAGIYEIPGIRFKWWDPDRQELKQQIIPGIKLKIVNLPTDDSEALAADSTEPKSSSLLIWAFGVLAVIIAGAAWRKRKINAEGDSLANEKSAFANLEKACKNNRAGKAHAAIYDWLGCCPPLSGQGPAGATLGEFSRIMGDDQLAEELLELQQALISTGSDWHGDGLLVSLKRVRRKLSMQKRAHSGTHLAPLNP